MGRRRRRSARRPLRRDRRHRRGRAPGPARRGRGGGRPPPARTDRTPHARDRARQPRGPLRGERRAPRPRREAREPPAVPLLGPRPGAVREDLVHHRPRRHRPDAREDRGRGRRGLRRAEGQTRHGPRRGDRRRRALRRAGRADPRRRQRGLDAEGGGPEERDAGRVRRGVRRATRARGEHRGPAVRLRALGAARRGRRVLRDPRGRAASRRPHRYRHDQADEMRRPAGGEAHGPRGAGRGARSDARVHGRERRLYRGRCASGPAARLRGPRRLAAPR